MILVSIYDKKSFSYAPPMAFDFPAQAIRSYIQFARQKPDATQIQFAEDYDLYDVGVFDEKTGAVTPCIPPNYIEAMGNIVLQSRKESQGG